MNPPAQRFAFLLVFACISAQAQTTPAPAPPSSPAKTASATAASPVTVYRNDSLKLTYSYPSVLQQATANSLKDIMERGHHEHFKTEPESDPEHQQMEKCMHFLLYATTPETATGTFSVQEAGDKPKVTIEPDPMGTIAIAEFDRSCVPPGAKDDDILGSIASIPGQIPGMKKIDQQMWYEVDKHKVHFLAAWGQMANDKNAAPMALAVASTAVEGRLLMWMFMSDDMRMLNRLFYATVQFGDHPAVPMAPFSLGNGEPIKLVPQSGPPDVGFWCG